MSPSKTSKPQKQSGLNTHTVAKGSHRSSPSVSKSKTALQLDPKNARLHPQRNIELIDASLDEVGAFRSIAVDGDNIIRAGNGVYQRAIEKGISVRIVEAGPNELIAVKRNDLHGRQAERAALLDNRSGEFSEWDLDVLNDIATNDRAQLAGLWSDEEIGELNRLGHLNDHPEGPAEINLDLAAKLQKKWGTKEGQVWQMPSLARPGEKHYLFIGDCRTAPVMDQVAAIGEYVGAITSPPYAEQRKNKYGGTPPDEYVEWWEAVQSQVAKCLQGRGSFFVNIKAHCEKGERLLYTHKLAIAMKDDYGWDFIDELVWVKPGYPGDMGKRFKNGFEPIYHFAQGDFKFRLGNVVEHRASDFGGYVENLEVIQGERGTPNNVELDTVRPSNVLHIQPDKSSLEEVGGHPARFPPALPEFFINGYSDMGDRWLDNFGGSGTTLIVCERNSRLSTMVELLPGYGAAILERYLINFGAAGELVPLAKKKKA